MSYLYVKDSREYLQREFHLRLQRRPSYSQRAFARDLNLAPSSLVDFFKGRIGFSKDRIHFISKKIGLTPEQKSHWLDLMNLQFSRSMEQKKLAQLRIESRIQAEGYTISDDEFKIISEWFHLAYLELIDMNSQKYSSIPLAAKALNIPQRTLKIAVNRLLKLNFLKICDKGLYKTSTGTYTGDTAPSDAVRHFHYQLLSKAQKALETQPMEQRFSSSTLIALSEEQLSALKLKLKSTALDLLKEYSTPTSTPIKNKLYCLSIHFFDLLKEPK